MEYGLCSFCSGKVIDAEPHYIPIGCDSVLKIVDQKCAVCGAIIIGQHQKSEIIKNPKAHDKLFEFYERRDTEYGK